MIVAGPTVTVMHGEVGQVLRVTDYLSLKPPVRRTDDVQGVNPPFPGRAARFVLMIARAWVTVPLLVTSEYCLASRQGVGRAGTASPVGPGPPGRSIGNHDTARPGPTGPSRTRARSSS